ncbi:hypothetical protein CA12_26920 [Alienimonas californiensis]|uniref:Secreted protein n=2 Tax=Alienimonas californiensis TaxID=2527989 RepID=A0A517PB44_9PLAN|nr:hypothetical protein CA12_26920 [Alienimonas californiensis]
MFQTQIRYGLCTLAAAGLAFSGAALSPVTAAHGQGQAKQDGSSSPQKMMCPMMAGLKGVELHADSPPLLLAQADELGLSEDQRNSLREIAEAARKQAREALTAEQREELGKMPEGPLSPMQIAKQRMRDGKETAEEKPMCPMCMKMMRKKAAGDEDSQDGDGEK